MANHKGRPPGPKTAAPNGARSDGAVQWTFEDMLRDLVRNSPVFSFAVGLHALTITLLYSAPDASLDWLSPQVVLLTAILALVLTTVMAWHTTSDLGLVVLMLYAYIFLAVIFGCLYYKSFLRNPMSYSFSSAIQEGQALESFGQDYDALARVNRTLLLASRLQRFPDVAWELVSAEPGLRTERRLPDGLVLGFTAPEGPPADPRLGRGEWYVGADGDLFPLIPVGGPSRVERTWEEVKDSDSLDELQVHLLSFVQQLQQHRDQYEQELVERTAAQPDWDLFDFIYLSTVSMTTLGFGDIVPNSREGRALVMAQAITGVFFIAYALMAFRAVRRRAHRAQEAEEDDLFQLVEDAVQSALSKMTPPS